MSAIRFAAVLTVLLLPGAASAQAYPTKPIRTVMAVAGGVEVLTRLVAQRLGESLGQPVIIDVQAGAGGAIGAEIVARAAPDGHTLLFAAASSQVVRIFTTKATSYDPVRDFTPITLATDSSLVLVAHPNAPVTSLRQVIDYAKQYPGKLSYGSSGIGTGQHLSMELLKQLTGADIVHVPYKGGAPAMTSVVSGEVPLATGVLSTASPQVAAGKVRLIAMLENKRHPKAPDVVAAGEVVPGFDPIPGWSGYFGPAGLPQPIVRRLNEEIVKLLNAPDVRAKAEAVGIGVTSSTPEELSAEIRKGLAVVARVVKAAGIEPQ